MNIKIHGDIILRPAKAEKGEIIKHTGEFIVAEGETTGHMHRIMVPNIEDMTVTRLSDGRVQLSLKVDGYMTHEEHKKLVIPAGNYVVDHEQEYDYFGLATRRVQD